MIKWTIPNAPVDPEVLARFRSHFPFPSEPPPVAWFMSGKIDWMTWLVETEPNAYSVTQLETALREIRAGLRSFPQVADAPLWKTWFHALLPYTLLQIDRDSMTQVPLSDTLGACAFIYPSQIDEIYPGFRHDVLNTLGTRIIPLTLSRDVTQYSGAELLTPILNDIWDFSNSPDAESPGHFEEFAAPMAFCLRYLTAEEMQQWVPSLLELESLQWRLALITWWISIYPMLKTESGIATSQFDPFDHLLRQHLNRDRFESWAHQITGHNMFRVPDSDESYPLSAQTQAHIAQNLDQFRQQFFGVR